MVIQTACLGLSTSDVEQLVTVPLEQALNGIEGLDDMRSKSVPQLSSIELIFKPGRDLLRARQLVQERLAAVSADPADLGRAAGHAGAGVGDRPGHADRHDVEGPLADRDVDDGVLDDPGPAARRCPAWPTWRIWSERLQMMTGAGRAAQDGRRSDVALDQVMEATADAVDSGLLQVLHRLGHRHRRHDRDAQPAARRPQRAADRHPGRPGQGAGARGDGDGADGPARRRRHGRRRTTSR